MKVAVTPFGEYEGNTVSCYTLTNDAGMTVEILELGGIIRALSVPDSTGSPHQCVKGFDTLDAYIQDDSYQGALIGRYANRIGEGKFELDGQQFQVDVNGGPHHLHGGLSGFHKKVWVSEPIEEDDAVGVRLSLVSPDGEAGFPGEVTVSAEYRLQPTNTLTLTLFASTTAATPFSMTQHAYFHIGKSKSVKENTLKIDAQYVTEADKSLLPTGKLLAVENTPFDFTSAVEIGQRVNTGNPLFDSVGGYDHNFVLNHDSAGPAAVLSSADTGIRMALYTTLPGMQVYTGNLMGDEQAGTICLEPQYFPDSPNHPDFPDCILRPGKPFQASVRYEFSR
ncbi:aldose epimerase family protein [Alteromonas sp. H39]|uniref:aldose epimerase family protein n=1 Tax=Alteromonas sp. H39 TaxID=3389876 RepID=UPI0039DF4BF6